MTIDDLQGELFARHHLQPKPQVIHLTRPEWLRICRDSPTSDFLTNTATADRTLLGLRVEIVEHAPDGGRIFPPIEAPHA